ncbi:unnamed protein product [Phytomonas sp. EM1]|nr:unnamed protein product [Phytomonas sp. EM1]|eukprot:CCW64053.1 unnamed protein product [Phytomonas sp. isolate EM1]
MDDDILLEECISANVLQYPKYLLSLVALITSLQPVYFSHAINGLEWNRHINALIYVLITILTTYILTQAYIVMVESEFWARQRHFAEGSEKDEKLLRRLRLQVAVGYTLFFVNGVFFLMCTCLMSYIFRHTDPLASYVLSPSLTSSLLLLIAHKNKESCQRRLRRHK